MRSRRAPLFFAPAAAMLAATLLAGCMPAQRAAPPEAAFAAPSQWLAQPVDAQHGDALQPRWWQRFGDAELNQAVEAALAHNSQIGMAAARVAAAQAQLDLASAASAPALSAAVAGKGEHTLTAAGITTSRVAQPQLQLSWEPDLWGRLRAQTQAAQAQVAATQAERDGVALAVAAQTTQAYIGLLALDAQLVQTRATADSRVQALRLAQDKARLGYASQLQLTQAEAEYESVQQALPQLELAVARQHNALRILTGELPSLPAPDAVAQGAARFAALQLPAVPATLPSQLLRRRPDLAQAEQLLAASDASLAARRAAFMPQVSLSAGLGGLYANALGYDPIKVWSLGGSVLAPLFDGGRLQAQYGAAAAQRDQAAFAYRGAALAAFGEVENALLGVDRLALQVQHAQQRRAILARSVEHARDRYEAGYSPYLEQLDAQRSLYQTEIELIRLRETQLDNLLALYKALGGGWRA
ncbi:efflux transporter outer membrane subunit [Xenophilus arseniciresistens]|uniref:Efflux transporter outer membrane subunit n=1 Tax=Xenophilus arseniciresistens TaxID=1283306 RepID=A0AAE3T1R3_9BURK|nr:efflux transporter outer membrane subunit [Xenophilus arseniciresistens]MDA7417652.1 efflux transporter outer membrane subunit [Xenophilus arseniciresistens]